MLVLLDKKKEIIGIENYSLFQRINFSKTTDKAGAYEFREVSETLAYYKPGEGWNPKGFRGGHMTRALIGPLPLFEILLKMEIHFGEMVIHGVKCKVRPCRADLMPQRLYEKSILPERRKKRHLTRLTEAQARRFCFAQRGKQFPEKIYFGKGTVCVSRPKGAVARIGSSESSTVVFLDKFARPLVAYKYKGSCGSSWAVEIKIPPTLDWEKLNSLSKSEVDALFGVRG